MDFMELMHTGGTIMWILLALSIVAAVLAIERAIFFASARGKRSPTSRIKEAAGELRGGADEVARVLELKAQTIAAEWERGLPALEMIAKISPLLGLLGTVLGMVEMFRTLNVGGGVSASAVTGGIWKALFTTVAGLSVAIPVTVVHSLLSSRVDRIEELMTKETAEIVASRCGDGEAEGR